MGNPGVNEKEALRKPAKAERVSIIAGKSQGVDSGLSAS